MMPTTTRAIAVILLATAATACDPEETVPVTQDACAMPQMPPGGAGALLPGEGCFWGAQCISGICLPTGDLGAVCAGAADCSDSDEGWVPTHTVSCDAPQSVVAACVPPEPAPSCAPNCAVGMLCHADDDCGPAGSGVEHVCVVDALGVGTCHAAAPPDTALLECYDEGQLADRWCAPGPGVRNVALEGASCAAPGADTPTAHVAINTVLRDVANDGGGAVYLPPCIYNLEETLLVDDATELFGHPDGSRLIRGTQPTDCVETDLPAPDHEVYVGNVPYAASTLAASGLSFPHDQASCLAVQEHYEPAPNPEGSACAAPGPYSSLAVILNANHMCGNVDITVRDLDVSWRTIPANGADTHPAVAMYSTAFTTLRRLHVHDVPKDGIFINNYGPGVVVEDSVIEDYLMSHNNGGGIIVETYERVPPSPLDPYLEGSEYPSVTESQLLFRGNRIRVTSPQVHDNVRASSWDARTRRQGVSSRRRASRKTTCRSSTSTSASVGSPCGKARCAAISSRSSALTIPTSCRSCSPTVAARCRRRPPTARDWIPTACTPT
ncbi:MAG: hypothetical protein AAF721_07090 [Myxococcota bacterium]